MIRTNARIEHEEHCPARMIIIGGVFSEHQNSNLYLMRIANPKKNLASKNAKVFAIYLNGPNRGGKAKLFETTMVFPKILTTMEVLNND